MNKNLSHESYTLDYLTYWRMALLTRNHHPHPHTSITTRFSGNVSKDVLHVFVVLKLVN